MATHHREILNKMADYMAAHPESSKAAACAALGMTTNTYYSATRGIHKKRKVHVQKRKTIVAARPVKVAAIVPKAKSQVVALIGSREEIAALIAGVVMG